MAEPVDESLTLVFSLRALKRLENPAGVFAGATEWSDHIGVIGTDPRVVKDYMADHDLRQDYFTGDRGIPESLSLISWQFDTERYVFIGTGEEEREAVPTANWEYLPVSEAAEKANWEVRPESTSTHGLLQFLRSMW